MHGAALKQLRDCLIAANLATAGVLRSARQYPEDGLSWRTDMIGADQQKLNVSC